MSENPYAAPVATASVVAEESPSTARGVLAVAWRLYRPHAGAYLAIMFTAGIALLALSCGISVPYTMLFGRLLETPRASDYDLVPPFLALCVTSFFWAGFCELGMSLSCGRVFVDDVIFRRSRRLSAMGVGIIGGVGYTLLTKVILLAFWSMENAVPFLGAIDVLLALVLAVPWVVPHVLGVIHAVEDGSNVVESVRFGWKTFLNSPVSLTLTMLVTAFIASVGALSIVGLFVTWPLVTVAWAVVYVREREANESPAVAAEPA